MKLTSSAVADAPTARRWPGLDAFRGLAVIGMLLVNNPGDHDAVFAPLRHSEWHGCTLADLVFPFFLFAVGITTTISLAAAEKRGDGAGMGTRIWKRAASIFAIGILLNWFPFYQSGPIAWAPHANALDRIVERLLLLRIPGVLQRIAICYLAAALIARRASSRTIAAVTASILLGYWALLGATTIDDPSRTIVAQMDRAFFDWTRWGLGNHLWDSALTWDPEGLLSTLPAIATTLLGVLCGRWMQAPDRSRRLSSMVLAGLIATVIGWGWGLVFPLNKSLWTSSYVLFTAGIATLVLAGLSAALERDASRMWARPLIIFGENPLVGYAGSELARHILHSSIKLPSPTGRLGVDEWTAQALRGIGFSPEAASLTWALLFVALWLAALSRLSRRRLLLRV